ncbi:MAG: FKBP-type peptidyl-prolyl cis-trans isomerase [Mucilaginibacter sp.]
MKKYIIYLAFITIAINANAQSLFNTTPKGTQYQIITAGNGNKIKLNDVITFNVVQKTDKDSVLFSTYKAGSPIQVQIKETGDLMDVFPLLAEKDSALVKINTDSVFKDNEARRPGFLPKGSHVVFLLKIERVQSLDDAIAERKAMMDKMAAAEIAARNKYIADNNLTLKTTASGLQYRVNLPSIKRKPVAGDSVLVNYTGRLIDGKIFDSSIEADAKKGGLVQPGRNYEPIGFKVGQQQVIPGWDEGLLLLGEGAKATFIVPSTLAYGPNGQGADIPPYSTLIFDVQLVKVFPAKHPVAAKGPVKKGTTAKKSTTVKKTTITKKKKS